VGICEDNGIYTSVIASVALLLIRIAIPEGQFLGRVTLVAGDNKQPRDVYVPLSINGSLVNPRVKVEAPADGIIVYRLKESVIFPNSSSVNTALVNYAREHTKRGKDMTNVPLSEQPWNDPGAFCFISDQSNFTTHAIIFHAGPSRSAQVDETADAKKSVLRAVVLDFSAVAHIDTTGVQNLIDTRKELERWADQPVEFHFASILSPWVRRALVAGGFGTDDRGRSVPYEAAPVIPLSASQDAGLSDEYVTIAFNDQPSEDETSKIREDIKSTSSSTATLEAPIVSRSTPYFHLDLCSAVRAAETFV
jgi:sodium-independent sulfate anion transporter 11